MKVIDIGKKEIKVNTKTFKFIMNLTWWPVETGEKTFSLFTLISVTRQSFILVKSFLLIKGNDSLKYKQTPPHLISFGWSALSNEYLFICMSSLGIVESKKVSDRHSKSKLLLAIKAATNGALIKSWAAKPLKLKWRNLMLDYRFGPGLISISW